MRFYVGFLITFLPYSLGISVKQEETGLTKVCLVDSDTKVAESENIVNKEKCFRFCEMTPGCLYWTWYKRHCEKLPCLDNEHTKTNVCYLLNRCQFVTHKCDGCWSGERWPPKVNLSPEKAEKAANIIINEIKQQKQEL